MPPLLARTPPLIYWLWLFVQQPAIHQLWVMASFLGHHPHRACGDWWSWLGFVKDSRVPLIRYQRWAPALWISVDSVCEACQPWIWPGQGTGSHAFSQGGCCVLAPGCGHLQVSLLFLIGGSLYLPGRWWKVINMLAPCPVWWLLELGDGFLFRKLIADVVFLLRKILDETLWHFRPT